MRAHADVRLANHPKPDADSKSAEREKAAAPQPHVRDDAYHFAAQLAHRGFN